jgi:DnaK suppressor protein
MRKTELERFQKLILEEKERVEKSLAKHTKIIHSNHMADQGSDEFQYETTIQFASSEGRYLYQLEQALLRIEDRSYGVCAGCSAQIGLERLKAKLDARLCIDCKEREEKERH